MANKFEYAISQSITGSTFSPNDTFEFSFQGATSTTRHKFFANQNVDIFYSASAGDGSYTRLPSTDALTVPRAFALGTSYNRKNFVFSVPQTSAGVKVVITGSVGPDEGTQGAGVLEGGLAAGQGDPGLNIDYDDFKLTVEKPKVEFTEDGMLVYASPSQFIKATTDGLQIKGGDLELNKITTDELEIFGDVTVFGDLQASSIPANTDDSVIQSVTASANKAGTNNNYAKADHQHQLEFSTLNDIVSDSSNKFDHISASFIDVENTLTADIIITRQITSSVAQISGSSLFGSQSSDTHEFTGSIQLLGDMDMTSDLFVGSHITASGNISSSGEIKGSTLDIDGTVTIDGKLTVNNDIDLTNDVRLANTKQIQFENNADDSVAHIRNDANDDLSFRLSDANKNYDFENSTGTTIATLGGASTLLDVTGDISATNITAGGNISASGDINIANEVRIRFASSSGEYSDDASLRRASGQAIRFRYDKNSFIFDAVENDDFEVRNSDDAPVFDLKTGDGTSYFSGSAGKFFSLEHSSGDIGIGDSATNPNHNLHIKPSTGTSQIKIESDANHAELLVDAHTGYDPNVEFQEAGATKWVVGVDTSNSDLFQIGTSSIVPNDSKFVINTSGQVGIGTKSPNAILHTNTSTNVVGRFQSSTDDAKIIIKDDDTTGYHNVRDGYQSFGFDGFTTRASLFVVSSSEDSNGVFGKVGIGTKDVSDSVLTVLGDISASGVVFADRFESKTGGTAIDFNDDIDVDGHITASGDISSSGTITGNAINVNGTNVLVAGGVDISDDTNLVGGTGITLTGDTLSTTDSEIVHDNLSGFVANEHIDHSGVEITAGAGLTGGGDITSTRDIAVGAGTGVTVNANDVAIGQDVATTANVQFNNITSDGNISASGTLFAEDDFQIFNGSNRMKYDVSAHDLNFNGGTFTLFSNANDIKIQSTNFSNAIYVDDSLQRVGIGTSSPARTLDVAGNIGLDSNILFDGAGTHFLKHESGTAASDRFTFRFNDNEDVFTVAGDGKVGINTTSPSFNLDVIGDASFKDQIGTSSFASGFSGFGWRINDDGEAGGATGSDGWGLTIDNLTVRNQMKVYELLINQIRASNGSVWISSVGKVDTVTALTAPSYSLTFDTGSNTFGHGFQVGDLIRAQRYQGGASEDVVFRSDLVVTEVGNSGSLTAITASTGNTPPTGGFDYVRIGNISDSNRQGSIYMTSDDDNAPYIDVIDGVTAHEDFNTSNNIKARLGKLDGINDSDFGDLTEGGNNYGLYSENVYLKGGIRASFGAIGGFGITSNAISASDNSFILSSSNMSMKLGSSADAITLNSGTGIFMSGSGEFRVGNPSADQFRFAGGDLQITASQINLSGSGVGIATSDFELGTDGLDISSVERKINLGEGKIILSGSTVPVIKIDGGEISASNFFVSSDGEMTASAGQIGGFTLGTNKISSDNLVLSSSTTATDEIISASNFNVKASGQLTASNVLLSGGTITGDMTMSSDVRIEGGLEIGALPELPSDENLLGYWSLGGASGSVLSNGDTILDNGGNNRNGEVDIDGDTAFSPSIADGPGGTSIQFLSESKAEIDYDQDTFKFNHTDEFSLSIWVKRFHPNTGSADAHGRDDGSTGTTQGIFVRGNTSNSYGIDYFMRDNEIRAGVRDSDSEAVATHTMADDMTGSFSHIVFTHTPNSTTGVKLYVDSELKSQKDNTAVLNFTGSNANKLELSGHNCLGGNGCRFNGFLAEPRVYNKVLTESEIRALYLNPAGNGTTLISGDSITTGKIQSNNFSTTEGSEFDLDNATFTLGGSSNPSLNFDGSNLTMSGSSVEMLTPNFFLGSATSHISGSSTGLIMSTSEFRLDTTNLDIDSANEQITLGTITLKGASEPFIDVANKIRIDTNGTLHKINSVGKDTFTDTDAGFFLAVDGTTPQINVGDSTSALKFDGTNIQLTASKVDISGSDVSIESPSFYLGDSSKFISGSSGDIEISSSNFHLQPDGDTIMSGKITSNEGNIAGWTITTESIETTTGGREVQLSQVSSSVRAAGVTLGATNLGTGVLIASLGQTFQDSFTGNTGLSVVFSPTVGDDKPLLRIDEATQSIADWNFNDTQIFNGKLFLDSTLQSLIIKDSIDRTVVTVGDQPLSSVTSSTENLFVNPSFEDGVDGYFTSSTHTIGDTLHTHNGHGDTRTISVDVSTDDPNGGSKHYRISVAGSVGGGA